MLPLRVAFVWAGLLIAASFVAFDEGPAHANAVPRVVPKVVPNDNRVAAGRWDGDTLRFGLTARLGQWHPDGDEGPGVVLPAFSEPGRAPRIPGPLMRVHAGSTVLLTVRNTLPNDTLRVHGLYTRPLASARDSLPLVLAPGEERTQRFRLDVAGTFYYWGTTMRRAIAFRTGLDAQLTGAIVVDPRGAPPLADRVFVMGMWTDTVARSFLPRQRVLGVINGRSWPATESLTASVGDSVRWRVINASGDLHPMHLHGFYFRVTARGDGTTDTLFTPSQAPLAVTEAVTMGGTYAMTWVPERPGNWLFHCHIPEHFGARAALGMPPTQADHQVAGPPGGGATIQPVRAGATHAGMSGLVLGVSVRPARGSRAASVVGPLPNDGRGVGVTTPRRLRLLVRTNVGHRVSAPAFGYAWHEGGVEPPPDTGVVAAPTLTVTRGTPVEITVVNRLDEPTSVHWHGIELESVYDGVPGFSGVGRRVTPLIAPRDSFTVRFTPPRAGTFIYHTHHDEERQLVGGLAGALLVLEPGQAFDGARDHVLLLTSPADFQEANRTVLVNASAPRVLEMRAGETHRLRVINMTMRRAGIRAHLLQGNSVHPWRLVAKDGASVPAALQPFDGRSYLVSIGETVDLEVTPADTGSLVVDLRAGPLAGAASLGRLPIRVISAPARSP